MQGVAASRHQQQSAAGCHMRSAGACGSSRLPASASAPGLKPSRQTGQTCSWSGLSRVEPLICVHCSSSAQWPTKCIVLNALKCGPICSASESCSILELRLFQAHFPVKVSYRSRHMWREAAADAHMQHCRRGFLLKRACRCMQRTHFTCDLQGA